MPDTAKAKIEAARCGLVSAYLIFPPSTTTGTGSNLNLAQQTRLTTTFPPDAKFLQSLQIKESETLGIADAAPHRFASVATTGVRSSARPAQRMGDVRRQVS
jgi:hypothetical protein